jgi:hypothetical protein
MSGALAVSEVSLSAISIYMCLGGSSVAVDLQDLSQRLF